MKLLFTGRGGTAAWAMRGEQMAAARPEWRAIANATKKDCEGCDAVVVVKHITDAGLAALKDWGGPVLYDALDFWNQQPSTRENPNPAQTIDNAEAARELFRPDFERIDPDIILCPTAAMARDLAPLGWQTEVHYHHVDPRLLDTPPGPGGRKRVLYHGKRKHFGFWKWVARISCRLHGAEFITSNGPQPAPADVMLAARAGRHGTWLSRSWKSNIKAATAMRVGVPFVAWPEAAYTETCPDGLWFTSPWGLHRAIGKALKMKRKEPEAFLYSVEWCAQQLERIVQAHLGKGAQKATAV